MLRFTKFGAMVATIVSFGIVLVYFNAENQEKDTIGVTDNIQTLVVSKSASCSIIQDILQSGIKNSIRKIKEKYKQVKL